jgi:hypothetical protein
VGANELGLLRKRVADRLAELKAARAEVDSSTPVYPYKQWQTQGPGGEDSWTGPLRPQLVPPRRVIEDAAIAKPDYADDADGTPHGEVAEMGSRQIAVLTPLEIAEMRVTCRSIPHHETFSTTIQPPYRSTKG